MKLIINNRTHWRSDHLRPFILRALRLERASLFVRQLHPVTFRADIKYNRGATRHQGCSGSAPAPGNWMRIMVPSGAIDRIDLALIATHEAAHTAGKHHDEMRGEPMYNRVGNWRELFAWAETFPLEKQDVQRKIKTPIGEKLNHARTMMALAVKREKGARTIRRKWEHRLKYYEKKVSTGPYTEFQGKGDSKMKCELSILDSGGDTRLMWDQDDKDEVRVARERFNDLKERHYRGFRVNPSGTQGEQMDEFDPKAERVIMIPRPVGG